MNPWEMRQAANALRVLALRLRPRHSPAAAALLEAAARHVDHAADRAQLPPVLHVGTARSAVVSREASYVEYDDGTRVPRP